MASKHKSTLTRIGHNGLIASATAACLFAFWVFLVDTRREAELLAGLCAVAIATLLSELVRRQRIAEVAPRLALFAGAWRAVARIPLDLVLVSREAILQLGQRRRRRGRFRALRFDGGAETPDDHARRALGEGFGSLAPNTYVVGIDPERNLILVHQLAPVKENAPRSIDPLELG